MKTKILSYLVFFGITGSCALAQNVSEGDNTESLKAEIMSVLNNSRWNGFYQFEEPGRTVEIKGAVINCFTLDKGNVRVETSKGPVTVDLIPVNVNIWMKGNDRDILIIGRHQIQISHKMDDERKGVDRKIVKSDFASRYYALSHLRELFLKYQEKSREEFVAEDFGKFKAAIETCKQQGQVPAITEEQRRYIIQANAANERKDYQTALSLYGNAVSVSPCSYPQAYYNMALLAAQTGFYTYAVSNMKKYLILVPEAADARAAQDKIYEWEYNIEH